LSTAAKAGIGAGATVGALLLIGFAIFYLRIIRKKRRSAVQGEIRNNGNEWVKAELSGKPVYGVDEVPQEMPATARKVHHELDAGAAASEIAGPEINDRIEVAV
jgi:hypothetical protein